MIKMNVFIFFYKIYIKWLINIKEWDQTHLQKMGNKNNFIIRYIARFINQMSIKATNKRKDKLSTKFYNMIRSNYYIQ